jgi:hypothetical protein
MRYGEGGEINSSDTGESFTEHSDTEFRTTCFRDYWSIGDMVTCYWSSGYWFIGYCFSVYWFIETSRSSSGTHYSGGGIEEEESPPHGSTSEKRKPKWLQDTLKESQGSVGNPRDTLRESKHLERFFSYLAMVRRISGSDPSNFEEGVVH